LSIAVIWDNSVPEFNPSFGFVVGKNYGHAGIADLAEKTVCCGSNDSE